MHPEAEQIGAVNCILIRDGERIGYNTDWLGFRDSLAPLLQDHHSRALVLGTGGASKAVCFALTMLGIPVSLVSRTSGKGKFSYNTLSPETIRKHPIIVNTTPVGMHPHVEEAPDLPYEGVTPKHLLYDLIYNPEQTRFLETGAMNGAITKNGHEMLVIQAEASWRIWQQHYATV